VNHDFRAVELAEGFEKFKSVPTEPISVGHNNLFDISRVDTSQKGLKVLAPVVEPRTDVLESCMVRVTFLEGRDLSFEVTGLFG